jgi:hypothetical protein
MQLDKILVFWMQNNNDIGLCNPIESEEILSRYQNGTLNEVGSFFVSDGPATQAMLDFCDRVIEEGSDPLNMYHVIMSLPKVKSNGR